MRLSRLLIQFKYLVQHSDRKFHVFFVYDYGNLDFRGRDHLNIDPLFRQGAKHPAGDADMGTHPHADDGYLGDPVASDYAARTDVRLHLILEYVYCSCKVATVYGKRKIGHTIVTNVLDNHIHINICVGYGTKNLIGDTRAIRN